MRPRGGYRRRGLQEEFYDVFASWPREDQRVALAVMSDIHRRAAKDDQRKKTDPLEMEMELRSGDGLSSKKVPVAAGFGGTNTSAGFKFNNESEQANK